MRKAKEFFKKNWKVISLWLIIILFIKVGFLYGIDKKITAIGIIIFGLITQAFTGLVGIIGFIPTVGPILAKILAWPIFATLNGLAFLVTFFALKRGQGKRVFDARVVVTIFLTGIIIGFILGNILASVSR